MGLRGVPRDEKNILLRFLRHWTSDVYAISLSDGFSTQKNRFISLGELQDMNLMLMFSKALEDVDRQPFKIASLWAAIGKKILVKNGFLKS